jgi:hypothetical protein
MKRWCLAAWVLLGLAAPGYCQLMTTDRLSETSACKVPNTYTHGVNMRINVQAKNNAIQTAFEVPLVQDISRFKDTGQILAGPNPNANPMLMGFDVYVSVSEM